MKQLSFRNHCLLFGLVLAAMTLIAVSPAHATWQWVHGHNGHVENPAVISNPNNNSFQYGWGLDFSLDSGATTWVHYAVPTIDSKTVGVRYVKVEFFTGSVDGWVSAIHVWDGRKLVKTLEGSWSGPRQVVTVDLGSVRSFSRGLGVSIEIKAGVEGMSHQFVMYGAGANFVNK